jgi:hypothetical protein
MRSFASLPSTRPRTKRIRKIVVHTTGGIRPPEGVFETLEARGCSAHYIQGADGVLYQTAPHDLVCTHAGEANEDSVGIECCSPLYPGANWAKEKERGVKRDIYRDSVRGTKLVSLLDLTTAQTASLLVHVEHLCDLLKVPRRVPLERDGTLLRRAMSKDELEDFEGVLGHFQVPTKVVKLDPGTRFLDRLRARWRAP